MPIPITQFITPPPLPRPFPPSVSICLFSTSVSLFLPCKLVHLYHFSRFHIHALIYLFFSFWLTSLCMTVSRSNHASTNDPISFLLARSWMHSTFKHWNLSVFRHCLHSPSLWGPPPPPDVGWGQSLEDWVFRHCSRDEREAVKGPNQAGDGWLSSLSLLCPRGTEGKEGRWRAPLPQGTCNLELRAGSEVWSLRWWQH